MPYTVIGLGSNLGRREALLARAAAALDAGGHGRVVAVSHVYESAPVGPPQPMYLNAALRFESELPAPALLDVCAAIEQRLGRVRGGLRWGPRPIDLDLLEQEAAPLSTDRLTVPHPRLPERPFALAPLLDVLPAHPRAPSYQAALARLGGAPPAHVLGTATLWAWETQGAGGLPLGPATAGRRRREVAGSELAACTVADSTVADSRAAYNRYR